MWRYGNSIIIRWKYMYLIIEYINVKNQIIRIAAYSMRISRFA